MDNITNNNSRGYSSFQDTRFCYVDKTPSSNGIDRNGYDSTPCFVNRETCEQPLLNNRFAGAPGVVHGNQINTPKLSDQTNNKPKCTGQTESTITCGGFHFPLIELEGIQGYMVKNKFVPLFVIENLNESTTKTKGLLGEARKMVKEIVKANITGRVYRAKKNGSDVCR